MKKYKFPLAVIVTFFIFILLNFGYYFVTNWRSFLPKKNSSSLLNQIPESKIYSNSKIGFELKYPAGWTVKENDNTVEITPEGVERNIYFSVSLRDDFKSLEDVKRLLSSNITSTPIQISGATGFKYKDTDDHDSIWLSHSNKIYVIRTYSVSFEANQILASIKFNN